MKLRNAFAVNAPVEDAYDIVTDIKRLAPCFPGARLDKQIDYNTFAGDFVVAIGPVTLNFAGKLKFTHRDPVARQARLRAQGKEQQGRGSAEAHITLQLVADNEVSRVELVTDLTLAGPVAHYSRGEGVLERVAETVLDEFSNILCVSLQTQMAASTADAGDIV